MHIDKQLCFQTNTHCSVAMASRINKRQFRLIVVCFTFARKASKPFMILEKNCFDCFTGYCSYIKFALTSQFLKAHHCNTYRYIKIYWGNKNHILFSQFCIHFVSSQIACNKILLKFLNENVMLAELSKVLTQSKKQYNKNDCSKSCKPTGLAYSVSYQPKPLF